VAGRGGGQGDGGRGPNAVRHKASCKTLKMLFPTCSNPSSASSSTTPATAAAGAMPRIRDPPPPPPGGSSGDREEGGVIFECQVHRVR